MVLCPMCCAAWLFPGCAVGVGVSTCTLTACVGLALVSMEPDPAKDKWEEPALSPPAQQYIHSSLSDSTRRSSWSSKGSMEASEYPHYSQSNMLGNSNEGLEAREYPYCSQSTALGGGYQFQGQHFPSTEALHSYIQTRDLSQPR